MEKNNEEPPQRKCLFHPSDRAHNKISIITQLYACHNATSCGHYDALLDAQHVNQSSETENSIPPFPKAVKCRCGEY